MYYGWVKQSEDEYLPEWLKSNIAEKCSCGSEMENFYNNDGRITKRRCSNSTCPHKIALKIVGMCDILQLKGIGEVTAEKLAINKSLNNQYEALPHILDSKPRISLYDFLRIAFIEGIDTSWSEVVENCESLDDVYSTYKGKYRNLLDSNKDLLYSGLNFVEIKQAWKPKHDAIITGTVMISGNLHGWNNRNDFIAGLNYVSDGYIRINVAESKRKTGVLALIQEADTPNRGKAECALANGIPIMTPAEFQAWVTEMLRNKLAKQE